MAGIGPYDLRDEKQAKEYLEKIGIEYRFQCLEQNLPDGCHRLGQYFEAFTKEIKKAQNVYKDNCDKNKYARSCFTYGHHLLRGQVEPDGQRAPKQTDASDVKSQSDSQTREDQGPKYTPNPHKAAAYYRLACDYGFADGCFNAGMLYLMGRAKTKFWEDGPHTQGLRLLEKCCDLDVAKCCSHLSGVYLSGKYGSVQRNLQYAFDYGKKACDLGDMTACSNVSQMYARGDWVQQNNKLALEYKERAKKLERDSKDDSFSMTFGQTS